MKKLKNAAILPALVLVFMLFFCVTAKAADVEINSTNFPDDNFRSYVSYYYDDDNDGILDPDAATADALRLQDREIANLKGIEYFPSIDFLDVDRNKLKSLDLSKNLMLERVSCNVNQLVSLYVSKNTNLERLECSNNKLTTLDVSNNSELEYLSCSDNNLKTLDVYNNTELWSLYCEGNKLTSLDLSQNTHLWTLFCSDNNLGALDVSKLGSLRNLSCSNCGLTELNVTACKYLEELECHDNSIATLEIGASKPLVLAYTEHESADSEDYGTYFAYGYRYFSEDDESDDNPGELYFLSADKATDITVTKPTISTQPTSKTVAPGKKVTFKVVAKGPGVTYQWQYKKPGTKKWVNVTSSAGKKASYSFTAAARHYKYQYRCKLTNGAGNRYSKAVTLTVKTKPVITSPTKATTKTVKKGKTVKLTVKANAAETYQWQYKKPGSKKWVNVTASSGKKATYSFKATLTKKGYKYRCKVKNPYGTTISKVFTLKVTS